LQKAKPGREAGLLSLLSVLVGPEGFELQQISKSFAISEIVREIDSHDPLKSRGLHP
jgi:hypothetical protein